ncbi:MAG: hypothetical protein ABW198_06500 [Pseudorhodoplanes sp.]
MDRVKDLPPLRPCPRCRITMQASRSNPAAGDYDTFTCLSCDLIVSYARDPQAPGRQRKQR